MEFLKTAGKALLITILIFISLFLIVVPFALIDAGHVGIGFILLFLYVFFFVLGLLICKP